MLPHFRDEAVTTPRNRFDITGFFGVVSQSLAQLLDPGVYSIFEINERIFRPETTLQFFASDNLSRFFSQQTHQSQR